jgi:hypothetical protein
MSGQDDLEMGACTSNESDALRHQTYALVERMLFDWLWSGMARGSWCQAN